MFIVYLTIYSGDKLPPFYIGSTSLKKFNEGYTGSVRSQKYKKIYYEEKINNPHLFDVCIVDMFETRKEAICAEYKYQKLNDVVKSDKFFNMSMASPNGFFGMSTAKEDNPFYNKKHTKTALKIMSECKLGDKNPCYGLKREKHSIAMKGSKNPFYNKKHTKEALIKCGLKNRTSPVWKYESALFKLWIELDKPKVNTFSKESINRGFPKGSYKNIVRQFERTLNDR